MAYRPDFYPNGIPSTKIRGRSKVTVSAKGIINGLSNIPNDGADFGPDSTLGSTSPDQIGLTYTNTSGLKEAINFLGTEGQIEMGDGIFNINESIIVPQSIAINGKADSTQNSTGTVFNTNLTSGNFITLGSSVKPYLSKFSNIAFTQNITGLTCIYLYSAICVLERIVINGNYGTALYWTGPDAVFLNCTFAQGGNNTNSTPMVECNSASTGNFINCRFESYYYCGCSLISSNGISFIGCIFDDNGQTNAYSISLDSGTSSIEIIGGSYHSSVTSATIIYNLSTFLTITGSRLFGQATIIHDKGSGSVITGNNFPAWSTTNPAYYSDVAPASGYINIICNNNVMVSASTPFVEKNPTTLKGYIVKNNGIFNTQGFGITTPVVPASGSTYENTFPFSVNIIILTASGATATITDANGKVSSSFPLTAGQQITLDVNCSITPTYTTLTWQFYGE